MDAFHPRVPYLIVIGRLTNHLIHVRCHLSSGERYEKPVYLWGILHYIKRIGHAYRYFHIQDTRGGSVVYMHDFRHQFHTRLRMDVQSNLQARPDTSGTIIYFPPVALDSISIAFIAYIPFGL